MTDPPYPGWVSVLKRVEGLERRVRKLEQQLADADRRVKPLDPTLQQMETRLGVISMQLNRLGRAIITEWD